MVTQAYFLLLVVVGLLNRFGLLTHDSYYNKGLCGVGHGGRSRSSKKYTAGSRDKAGYKTKAFVVAWRSRH